MAKRPCTTQVDRPGYISDTLRSRIIKWSSQTNETTIISC
ncbi:unnamed protein product, partial [Rotaria magnacalcarata]